MNTMIPVPNLSHHPVMDSFEPMQLLEKPAFWGDVPGQAFYAPAMIAEAVRALSPLRFDARPHAARIHFASCGFQPFLL